MFFRRRHPLASQQNRVALDVSVSSCKLFTLSFVQERMTYLIGEMVGRLTLLRPHHLSKEANALKSSICPSLVLLALILLIRLLNGL